MNKDSLISLFILTAFIMPMYKKIGYATRKIVMRLLIKTEKQAVLYFHRKFRAMKLGHHPKHAQQCTDGKCAEV